MWRKRGAREGPDAGGGVLVARAGSLSGSRAARAEGQSSPPCPAGPGHGARRLAATTLISFDTTVGREHRALPAPLAGRQAGSLPGPVVGAQ